MVKKTDGIKFIIEHLNLYYEKKQALFDVSIAIPECQVISFIGPSGCGKSSILRCLNRMHDEEIGIKISGIIELDGINIYGPNIDTVALRSRVGMVFQKPNPFPGSIFDNVAYGPRIHNMCKSKSQLDNMVKDSLNRVGLYGEVKDKLDLPANLLSGGQQQRLCIARTIAIQPEVILMDEPTSALDPIATARIESLMEELCQNYTIILVTHSLSQAARISHKTAFFQNGHLIEFGDTDKMFTNPKIQETKDYIMSRKV